MDQRTSLPISEDARLSLENREIVAPEVLYSEDFATNTNGARVINIDGINWLLAAPPNIRLVDDTGYLYRDAALEILSEPGHEYLSTYVDLVPEDVILPYEGGPVYGYYDANDEPSKILIYLLPHVIEPDEPEAPPDIIEARTLEMQLSRMILIDTRGKEWHIVIPGIYYRDFDRGIQESIDVFLSNNRYYNARYGAPYFIDNGGRPVVPEVETVEPYEGAVFYAYYNVYFEGKRVDFYLVEVMG